jgi:hypothetical protein
VFAPYSLVFNRRGAWIMANTSKREKRRQAQRSTPPSGPPEKATGDHPLEEHPAVERGERIDTGKTIARGGKATGHVPGATEQPRRKDK